MGGALTQELKHEAFLDQSMQISLSIIPKCQDGVPREDSDLLPRASWGRRHPLPSLGKDCGWFLWSQPLSNSHCTAK